MTTFQKSDLSIINCVSKDKSRPARHDIIVNHDEGKMYATDDHIAVSAEIQTTSKGYSTISKNEAKVLASKANHSGEIQEDLQISCGNPFYPALSKVFPKKSETKLLMTLGVPILEKLVKLAKSQKVDSIDLNVKGYKGAILHAHITSKIGNIQTVFMPYIK